MTSLEDIRRLFAGIHEHELAHRAQRALTDPRVQPAALRAIIQELLNERSKS